VLAIALAAVRCGVRELYVPLENATEAALVAGVSVFACDTLTALLSHLLGANLIIPLTPTDVNSLVREHSAVFDLADVSGQEGAKRALEIASSGGHNVLMSGPPGSGKTLLARAMGGILPDVTLEEVLELTKIYSIAGKLPASGVVSDRPVRSPHHTTSSVALVGGGQVPRPGEITLAHRGVLFLDELPEFARNVLEALRQPLEDGVVTVSRAKNTFTYPAKFILMAAQNPCPCGYAGDGTKKCVCSAAQVFKYQKRLSGPLLDRIDLHIEVPRLSYEKISATTKGELSSVVKARVEAARHIQYQRFGKTKTNSEMNVVDIREHCKLGAEVHAMLALATKNFNLSGRSIHRLLKVARTIADLKSSQSITSADIAEALQYRPKQD
jgi:magnesium chelatase family protein